MKPDQLEEKAVEIQDRYYPQPDAPEREALEELCLLFLQVTNRTLTTPQAADRIKEIQASHPAPFTTASRELIYCLIEGVLDLTGSAPGVPNA